MEQAIKDDKQMELNSQLSQRNQTHEISMMRNKVTRYNLIACCILWSMASFVQYLIIFYSKYFKGNFYINYSIQGIADGICMVYVSFLSKRFNVPGILRFLVILLITMAIINMTQSRIFGKDNSNQVYLLPIMILLIRLQVTSIQKYGYHIN